jgi:hypothetical protein
MLGRPHARVPTLRSPHPRGDGSVAALRRGMQIHECLTRVAAAGEGSAGIAEALHDLTGLPVAVEDRYGNLSAWAGPGRPSPYPKAPAYDMEQLLRRLMLEGRSVRDSDRVVALASPRPGVLGLIALMDPDRRRAASAAADCPAWHAGWRCGDRRSRQRHRLGGAAPGHHGSAGGWPLPDGLGDLARAAWLNAGTEHGSCAWAWLAVRSGGARVTPPGRGSRAAGLRSVLAIGCRTARYGNEAAAR